MLAFYLSVVNTEEDKDLFKKLYIEHRDKLCNYAYSILKDYQLSEDSVEEAFSKLANNMKKLSGKTSVQICGYLMIIVRNICYETYNMRKRESFISDIVVEDEELEELVISVENKVCQERVFEIIKNLDPKYGDVLMLKYYYGKKEKEIARELGISLGNVKVRILRAKEKVKKAIREEGIYDKF